jgi:hypothetical protein
MRIEDFDSKCDVTKPEDVEVALNKRHVGGINAFWLSHGTEKFPAIGILVKGELANVHFFPRERHPGFTSVANVFDHRSNETSIFFVRPTEKTWVRNDALVPFSDALKVAQEFAASKVMPKCIQWFEL